MLQTGLQSPVFLALGKQALPFGARSVVYPMRLLTLFSIPAITTGMKQTMLLKLVPTTEQHQALLDTMHHFNAACDYVASVAFAEKTANKFALQKLVYGELRTTYKLAAQLAIRAMSKASEAYKREKSIQPTFKPEGAVVYDERVMSFKGLLTVSLLTTSGRVLVPFLVGGYQTARMDSIKGQADLIYRKGVFYLAVTLDVPIPTPDEVTDTLGVDLGIINLATDSEGETFSGEQVEKVRRTSSCLASTLAEAWHQECQTASQETLWQRSQVPQKHQSCHLQTDCCESQIQRARNTD